MESKRVFFVAQMGELHSGKRPLEDVWILLKMGIFQPAMLVYQRVGFFESTELFCCSICHASKPGPRIELA